MNHPYLINAPRIVHETIDDETVIIDFDTGAYYSTRGVGNRIWLLLCDGKSGPQIVEYLVSHYAVEEETAAQDAQRFISELCRLSLIVEDKATGGQVADATEPMRSSNEQAQQAYATPVLDQFTDMQDLLLLDPIHDVGAQGWPHRPVS